LLNDIFIVLSVRYEVEEVKAFGLIQNSNIRLKCSRI
jgi:hypothetical protein